MKTSLEPEHKRKGLRESATVIFGFTSIGELTNIIGRLDGM
jgi:hypothetical protein